ncbi:autoinducer 2 ABC transporter substrate-binding protein [Halalkalibacter sp. APA_J-10(15)]|uniref:autoinducer 2 ABC transporter substrate-binding protein n=1 Tax=Halalkalibacter sp. APA_J-10(15) TaxID=2933805 RepID=UPI001FF634AC|nr:autoinducer 2 ABC transporter substrate-binding protein [Halalkalibacter sp. APA_J-10(15)]MCK0471791.1 autoinducer 2 ABC transporter substrate-binding protein [Halalkalibacter sp. APA_J-10(15)]
MSKLKVIAIVSVLIVSAILYHQMTQDEAYVILYSSDQEPLDFMEKEKRETYRVAMVPKQVDIHYFNSVEMGATEAAANLGVELIYRGPVIVDSRMQIEIIQDLIEEGVDLLAISVIDPDSIQDVIMEAHKKGIEVITWDSDTSSHLRTFFINMVNPETLGRHLMDTMAWTINESGDFAILGGSTGSANIREWLNWIQVQHEEFYPNMNLIDIVTTDDDPVKAYDEAVSLIEMNPNLRGVIGTSSVGPPAAAQAVSDLGLSGDIHVVGLSSPVEMRQYLLEGSAQMTTLWSPKKLGYLTISLAHQLLEEELPTDLQNIANVGRIRFDGDTVIMGEPIDFTKDNVDQYDF